MLAVKSYLENTPDAILTVTKAASSLRNLLQKFFRQSSRRVQETCSRWNLFINSLLVPHKLNVTQKNSSHVLDEVSCSRTLPRAGDFCLWSCHQRICFMEATGSILYYCKNFLQYYCFTWQWQSHFGILAPHLWEMKLGTQCTWSSHSQEGRH